MLSTLLLVIIVVFLIYIAIFEYDMGEYLGNIIEYLNNNSNSVVFKHLDDFLTLLENALDRIYEFFVKIKEKFIKHE